MYMHGREEKESENRRRRIIIRSSSCSPHMRSVPLITTTRTTAEEIGDSPIVSTAAITTNTPTSTPTSFCKDGRKISVGDCALFKPSQDSPPFIGLIHWLTFSKENSLQLGVNWLYRPTEVKLGKGILLEAAPNEVFYSFHKDAIPAASLLHPCKVAFLPKGVELPTGISSFVCRRVYDIANKCLCWLTDQDYIDERQEEVDKLLDKTRIEMDTVVQPGGRSPKPTSISISISQLKPGSDNLQNTATSMPSQTKGKKRERGDHLTEPIKRERLLKTDDCDSIIVRTENSLKSEIAKITEKGGLVDCESVAKLVQLMQPDRIEKKIDLNSRSMLAGVIAATDRFDCLSRFVQLKGLPVLDEWLQDVQKRKMGDGSSSKDGDKSSEEFLLVLLRALDKLPVNLNALQTSNIGRSVNHLRSHKNLDIQKKARSLVDTWKKRVEAEMNVIDAKSASTQTASWPSKSHLPDSHGARNSGESGDIALKSSVTQLSPSNLVSIKGSQGETAIKSSSSSPGPLKSATSPASGKEGHPRTAVGSTSDFPLSTREDKSGSCSQSHNYSQSLSGKEDARSSTTGSMTVNKISSGSSQHRKSTNGFPGASVSGSPKGAGSSRNSSISRNATQEKFSQPALMGEKTLDVPAIEGSSHKLIVKIPNLGHSPAQSIGGGSSEDPYIMSSRASSPVLSDRHEQTDSNSKEKCDTSRVTVDVNAESWQSNDTKDLQTGSDEGDGSPADLPEEEHSRIAENTGKPSEVSKVASSSSGNDLKSGKLYDPSFNSMYALIESCAKYAETSPSVSVGDDIGMNLLASVAAGEMCKSDLVSTSDFPQGSTSPVEEICTGDDAKSKPSPGGNYAQDQFQSNGTTGGDEQAIPSSGTWSKDEIPLTKKSPIESSGDRKPPSALSEETLEALVDDSFVMKVKSNDTIHSTSVSHNVKVVEERDCDESKQPHKAKGVCDSAKIDRVPDTKLGRTGSLLTEGMASNVLSSTEDVKQKMEVSLSIPSKETDCKKEVNENLRTAADLEQKPALMADRGAIQPPVADKDLIPENLGEVRVGEADKNRSISCSNQSVGPKLDNKISKSSASDDQSLADFSSAADQRSDCTKDNVKNKVVSESCSTASSTRDKSPVYPSQDVELKGSELCNVEADKTEKCISTVADTTVSASKMKFDLNEGLNGDHGKYGEPISLSVSGCLSSVHVVNTLSSSFSSSSGSIPASIAVAAAAKGPFVPPVDLLRSKGELGWKGSAATSAFRPAEPRKVPQLPVRPINASPDDSTSRPCRPPLDIDLNVPDERLLEDLACRDSAAEVGSTSDHSGNHHKSRNDFTGSTPGRSSGGLDLDLNRVDDANDMIQFPASSSRRLEDPIVPVKSVSSGSLSASEVRRDFDLNNGPGVDDPGPEQSLFHLQSWRSTQTLHTQAPVVGTKPSSLEAGNFSAWFPRGNSYSSVTIPPVLPAQGEQTFPIIPPGAPQRIFGLPGGNPFTPEIYRGSVLSSTPAVHFPSSPYQMFPFGTTLPLPSATFSVGSTSYIDSTYVGRLFNPAMNSQFLAPVGAVSSQYPRPYMVSLPDDVTNGSVENSKKWSRQGLDLNAGPGSLDLEGREETLAQRQLLAASSHVLAEEQARIYPVGGSVLKRKEPEGGWDSESFRYKQPSWL